MARTRPEVREERLKRRRRRSAFRQMMLVAVVAVVCLTGFAVVRKTFRPVGLYLRERAELRKSEAALRDMREDNKNLQVKKKYLESPTGAQAEARKLGYVRAGEIPIVIHDEKSTKESSDSKDK